MSFSVKFAFFTVFVLTLQTDFVARWCFLFSANGFFVGQVCPSLLYARRSSTPKKLSVDPWGFIDSPVGNQWFAIIIRIHKKAESRYHDDKQIKMSNGSTGRPSQPQNYNANVLSLFRRARPECEWS